MALSGFRSLRIWTKWLLQLYRLQTSALVPTRSPRTPSCGLDSLHNSETHRRPGRCRPLPHSDISYTAPPPPGTSLQDQTQSITTQTYNSEQPGNNHLYFLCNIPAPACSFILTYLQTCVCMKNLTHIFKGLHVF